MTISELGLILDIIGVMILFVFGVDGLLGKKIEVKSPSQAIDGGDASSTYDNIGIEIDRRLGNLEFRTSFGGKLGIFSIMIGFALQLSYVQNYICANLPFVQKLFMCP